MAIYRNVSLSFWEDNKVVDDFTYKDKYFLLYLLTNPHTNLIGCYEISIKQMSIELDLNKSEVEELLARMEQVHNVIIYAGETKELLIKNWHKYNWTKSEKLLKKVEDLLEYVKSEKLKKYMEEILNKYRVSIGYPYHMDTSVSVSVSDTVSDTINDNLNNNNIFSIVESNFGRTIAPIEYEEINSWRNDFSNELIKYAVKIAVLNNACSVKYISRILYDWKKKNILTVEQAKQENEKFLNKRGNSKNIIEERDKWENE